MAFTDNASSESIDQREHNNDAAAKRVVQYFQDTAGDWLQVPVEAIDTSTDVSLASSASSAQLVAPNISRAGLLLNNTDANPVYIYYGTTATTSKYSVRIPPDSYWEMPHPIYTGRIDAIWSADGSGSLIGSEL